MKRLILHTVYLFLLAILFYPVAIKAQGVYQLGGTTTYGGQNDFGVIFSTSTIGDHFQKRFDFKIENPGASPTGDLVEYNGKFYGMTTVGGANNVGVIFEWDPYNNSYIKKFDFSIADGYYPRGSLSLNEDRFYGITLQGGTNNAGVIFEWHPATNVYTKKIDFNFADGYFPFGNLTLSSGKYYGVTLFGGTTDNGVIFEWDPVSNVYHKRFDFSSTYAEGRNVGGSLTLRSGKLYGMMIFGGTYDQGVIFEWDPVSNLYTKKKDFNGIDGGNPQGILTLNGDKFYGTTTGGGANNVGVIFVWNPATNLYTKKIDLKTISGSFPTGSLTFSGGKFYGMTGAGGSNDQGVIFEWDANSNVYTKKIDLSTTSGSEPLGSLTLHGNKFYGMTWKGGSQDQGVIFEWEPSTNVFTKKIQFNSSDGRYPESKLSYNRGKLYGSTFRGGNYDLGVLYEWDPANSIYIKKIDLNRESGYDPEGALVLHNEKFYGITRKGGSDKSGVIFEWDPVANIYTKKIDLSLFNGTMASGSLTYYNGRFYGATFSGGDNDGGVIFEWDPTSNIYLKKIQLSVPDDDPDDDEVFIGRNFTGSLTHSDGKFYGMTVFGGTHDQGVIFEWDPATNVYTKKIDLNEAGGKYPSGSLTLYQGKFYGTTSQGGNTDAGIIFEWDPVTNNILKKIDFSDANGSTPLGSLTLKGGKFYGTANSGGSNDRGAIFEWDPVTNIYITIHDFNGTDGTNPVSNDLTLAPAPVASGIAGSCVSFPVITIDSSNNNIWVPITDTLGNAVAEIKANGNNLGNLHAAMFINDAPVREDKTHRLYLDRNITLTPEVQPTSPVDIRLYIKDSEYQALKNASNSLGQPSGIDSINEVSLFKNNDGCLMAVKGDLVPVISSVDAWQNDYVFLARVDSFSSFYFASKAGDALIPPTITITTPVNNATYLSGGNVYLNAIASDADGNINKVEFYRDSTLLYTATYTPFTFKWEHVNTGNYTLTAKATDNSGLVTTSDSIRINVVPNTAPTVSIINPANEQAFLKGATIRLEAAAQDPDGRVTKVEFYNGSALLATESKLPYTFNWSKVPVGSYNITAKATDNWGAITTSGVINLSVVANKAPSVSIISPANGESFTLPATITLEAAAADPDGRIIKVDFYNGATLLNAVPERKPPYIYQWQNVPAGVYIITAVTQDNWGETTTSAPVILTVTSNTIVSSKPSVLSNTTNLKREISLQLAPNPAKDIVNIYTAGLQKDKQTSLSIISATGSIVKTIKLAGSNQTILLGVSSLASGVYSVRIINGDKMLYKKLVRL